jgi:predicted dienelactone hydrolase
MHDTHTPAPIVNCFRLFIISIVILLGACSNPPDREERVGRTGLAFTDAGRTAWTGEGPRPITTTVWYPADSTAQEVAWTVGVFRAGWTAPDAPLSDRHAPLPLVILSHGTGGAAAQLSWLAEELASNGYVVAAVHHHGNTALEERPFPQGFVLWWERARDITAVIDQLLADARFGPHVDSTRIGVAGFSLGGYTALAVAGARVDRAAWERYCETHYTAPTCSLPPEAPFTMTEVEASLSTDQRAQASLRRADQSFRDPRVGAAFAIAPVLGPALNPVSLASISIPVRVVVGTADDQAVPDVTARPVAQMIPRADLELIPGAGHYTFLAPCSLRGRVFVRPLCVDGEGIDRRDVHARVAAGARRFFDRSLPSSN